MHSGIRRRTLPSLLLAAVATAAALMPGLARASYPERPIRLVLPFAAERIVAVALWPFFWGLANHFCMTTLVSYMNTLSARLRGTIMGLFSPDSISLRTTLISVSRSLLATKLLTMRSASIFSAQSRLSSLAAKVSK